MSMKNFILLFFIIPFCLFSQVNFNIIEILDINNNTLQLNFENYFILINNSNA